MAAMFKLTRGQMTSTTKTSISKISRRALNSNNQSQCQSHLHNSLGASQSLSTISSNPIATFNSSSSSSSISSCTHNRRSLSTSVRNRSSTTTTTTSSSSPGVFDGMVRSSASSSAANAPVTPKSIDLVLGNLLAAKQPRHTLKAKRGSDGPPPIQSTNVSKELASFATQKNDSVQELNSQKASNPKSHPISPEDLAYLMQVECTAERFVDASELPRVTMIFDSLSAQDKSDSGIFSPHLLVQSVQTPPTAANGKRAEPVGYTDLWTLLSKESTIHEVDGNGQIANRKAYLHAASVLEMTLGRQQDGAGCGVHEAFRFPLGGSDVNTFVRNAAMFSEDSVEFFTIANELVSSLPTSEPVSAVTDVDSLRPLVAAWKNVPAITKTSMPDTAAFVDTCNKHILNHELVSILKTIEFKVDWAIADCDWSGSDLNVDVDFVHASKMVTSIALDENGKLSEDDLNLVDRLKLPPHASFETKEEMVIALQELHEYLSILKQPHAEADDQYLEWYDMFGVKTAVPLEKAHAYFTQGIPLLSEKELSVESKYRYPSILKIGEPKKSQATPSTMTGRFGTQSNTVDVGHFTNRSQYYNSILQVERLMDFLDAFEMPDTEFEKEEYDRMSALIEAEAPALGQFSWRGMEQMQRHIGGTMGIAEYRTLVSTLNAAWLHPRAGLIRDRLAPYMRATVEQIKAKKKSKVDALGRVRTVGRRKNSSAVVTVTPGTGELVVNDKSLAEYFARPIDRYEVLRPLEMVEMLSDYDVTLRVKGGGNSGQAGACRHAITRAIMELKPESRPVLKAVGYVTRDPRMVERKKPGQKKARKKFQWVKR